MAKKKINTETTCNYALGISVLLTGYFFIQLLMLLQDVRINDILGSPSTYAGVPSGLLAIYVFTKSKSVNKQYVAISILTVVVVGFLVWLYGTTGAGSGLVRSLYKKY